MKPYTVLLLRPEHQRDGDNCHPSDWVYRAHVTADTVDGARHEAKMQLERGDDGVTPAARSEVWTLAVFEGHHKDIYHT